MKLIDLEINNFRGIKNVTLQLEGQNAVIWGPNGSGKSAVVDALDFLFTGNITRLTGPGTGDIDIARHGPHVDKVAQPATSWVRATVQSASGGEPVSISRSFADPGQLVVAGDDAPTIETALAIAARGHNLLTRRQILNFITSQSRDRAQLLQELLNVRELETIRTALVSLEGRLQRALDARQQSLDEATGALLSNTGLQALDEAALLVSVNQKRALLGGQPLDELLASRLKDGLQPPRIIQVSTAPSAAPSRDSASINTSVLQTDTKILSDLYNNREFGDFNTQLHQLEERVSQAEQDPVLSHELKHQQLVLMGIELLADAQECPLCQTPWDPTELRTLLERRRDKADRASQLNSNAKNNASELAKLLAALSTTLSRIDAAAKLLDLEDAHADLSSWISGLEKLRETFKDPFDNYRISDFRKSDLTRLMAPDRLPDHLNSILTKAKMELPRTTPEHDAWEFLTILTVTLRSYENATMARRSASAAHDRADALLQAYLYSRDAVLQSLYDAITDRFVELYRTIHTDDEAEFSALLEPRGAGVAFEVSFYGRGTHPPHALHSEGHQDSMGICLFLALAEKLGANQFDVIVLDDVVMSVDRNHRRAVCTILAKYFPSKQFIITTHEKFWAYELSAAGIVPAKSMFEFYNWTIETGPKVMHEATSLQKVHEELLRGSVDTAAQAMRKVAEHFFSLAGEKLEARVPIRLSGNWDLGDLASAAKARLNELLAKAKDAANSWNQRDKMEELRDYANRASDAFNVAQIEQWGLNPTVHFNEWAQLSPEDFKPILESFEALFSLFECPTCHTLLFVSKADGNTVSVSCHCGQVNWNLIKKRH
jgi:recombinational DNA repair ATPase RecF